MYFFYYLHQDTAKWHAVAMLFLYCSLTKGKPLVDNFITVMLVIYVFAEYLAIIELVPAEVVYICPGGQLDITCKTNATFIEWNVTVPQYQRSSRYVLSSFGTPQSIGRLRIDESNIFSVSKLFDENLTLPLASVMFSDSVTDPINGTLITCTDYHSLDSNLDVWITETLSTRLHIIEPGAPSYGRL